MCRRAAAAAAAALSFLALGAVVVVKRAPDRESASARSRVVPAVMLGGREDAEALVAPLPLGKAVPESGTVTDAPTEDLTLVGILGSGAALQGLFALTTPQGGGQRFALAAGGQNEWLEVRSIDPQRDVVTVLLKRPVVRVRNVGVEVLLRLPGRNGGGNQRAR